MSSCEKRPAVSWVVSDRFERATCPGAPVWFHGPRSPPPPEPLVAPYQHVETTQDGAQRHDCRVAVMAFFGLQAS